MSQTIVLSYEMVLVLSIVAFTIILSISNVIRIDIVAVLVLVIIGITQLLPPTQLFSGFSSEAVISLIAVMIIGGGLEKSGIAIKAARWILTIGREHPNKISHVLMLTSGLLSSFMRAFGTVALLLPVVTRITLRTGIPKSRLLMPMAFCSILGGTLSMVGTSPLIILNSLLNNVNDYAAVSPVKLEPFHLFSVFPMGLVMLLIGVLYFSVLGNKLLPKEPLETFHSGTKKKQFWKTYQKGGDIFELNVEKNSPLLNLNLRQIESRLDASSSLLAVSVDGKVYCPPLRKMVIIEGTHIAIMGHKNKVENFAKENKLKLLTKLNIFNEVLHPVRAGLCEVVIPPSSQLVGLDLNELHMRRTYQVHVLAVYRGNTVYQGDELRGFILRSGDTLGMFCRWEALSLLRKNPDIVVVTTAYPREEIRAKKAKYALLSFLVAISLILIWGYPVSVGLLMGAMGMIASGVLTIDEAYECVSWKSVFLMAGLIPLGLVMQSTHTTDWLTQHTLFLKEDLHPLIIQAGLAFLATTFSIGISPIGATIVLVPIALELATNVGADPRIYALIVAIAASNSFLMPAQQVNVLIKGPGNYRAQDFLRVGLGMTLLYWVTMLICINIFF